MLRWGVSLQDNPTLLISSDLVILHFAMKSQRGKRSSYGFLETVREYRSVEPAAACAHHVRMDSVRNIPSAHHMGQPDLAAEIAAARAYAARHQNGKVKAVGRSRKNRN